MVDDSYNEALKQLSKLMALPNGPFHTQLRKGYQRGIDFYSMSSLIKVLSNSMNVFRKRHGLYPNIVRPQGFNQKIFYRKFFEPILVTYCGNKLKTSSFIPDDIKSELKCPDLLWHSQFPKLPDNDALPAGSYYVKANHGSNFYELVTYPLTIESRALVEKKCSAWLQSSYGLNSGEWWYNVFTKEILIEKNVSPNADSVSLNFFVVKGSIAFICMHLKATDEELYLDSDFNPIEFKSNTEKFHRLIRSLKNETLKQLSLFAQKVGASFSFVRVDFFLGEGEDIYLAELTLSPGNALSFRPRGFDEKLGEWWAFDHEEV